MKKIVLFISLCIGFISTVSAQVDYCKEIKKKTDEMTGHVEYISPSLSVTDNITISKSKTSENDTFSIIDITVQTTQNTADYEADGSIYIKFEDGTVQHFTGKVSCSYLNTQYPYLFIGGSILHASTIIPFKTKKIVKFQIAGKDVNVPDGFATKFMAWVNCIADMK